MGSLNTVLNSLSDLMFWPFRGESPWPGMIAVACLTGAVFVAIFGSFSNQRALKRKKGRMLARALELLLFRHDLVVSLTAFPRIAVANGSYFGELLKPTLVAIIPSILLLIQLACWFEYRPFLVGEPVLVTVDFDDDVSVMSREVELTSSKGLAVETQGLRVPKLNQINWRLDARQNEIAWVEIMLGETAVRKDVVVDTRMQRVSDARVRTGLWNQIVHPGEQPLPRDVAVREIHVRYPRRELMMGDHAVPWIVAFLLLTMISGLICGRLMKVSF